MTYTVHSIDFFEELVSIIINHHVYDRYFQLCLSSPFPINSISAPFFACMWYFLIPFRVSASYGNVWTVHSLQALEARWGFCSLSLSLIYRRMQRVARQGYTHSSVFVYTHTRTCTQVCPFALSTPVSVIQHSSLFIHFVKVQISTVVLHCYSWSPSMKVGWEVVN